MRQSIKQQIVVRIALIFVCVILSIQGYTMSEIADKICLSPETIKKYRQRIFEKLDVRNISEAIVAAANNKLL